MKVENKMTPENGMYRFSPSANMHYRESQGREKSVADEGK